MNPPTLAPMIRGGSVLDWEGVSVGGVTEGGVTVVDVTVDGVTVDVTRVPFKRMELTTELFHPWRG